MPSHSSDFAAARKVMVLSQLRPQGVTDPAVLAAMAAVPREDYRARQSARAWPMRDRPRGCRAARR